MKHNIIITVVLFFSALANIFGQSVSNCSVQGPLYVKVEHAAAFNGSLQEYFENELKGQFENFKGTVQLQILIDTSGKACCMNADSTPGISSIKIKEAVNRMTGWKAAIQNNHTVNFSAMLQITFSNSKLSVNYLNEKPPVIKPVVNTNTANNPTIVKDRKTKTIWKLWNFANSMVPANLARNVAMDSKGIIWYCTDNGIVKMRNDDYWQVFNGINVEALSGKNSTTWTTGMAVDKADNVWVQSFGNVIKFDGKEWTKFDTSNSPLSAVRKICVDKNGIIWFCTFRGLIKYDGKSWTKFATSNSKIVSDNVREVYVANDETIWIATDKGINKVVNDNWSLINTTSNSNIPDNDFTAIKGDQNGNIWAGIGSKENKDLVKIDAKNNVSVFPTGFIWNITVDNKSDKIWLATNGKGLISFDGKDFTQYDKSNSIIPNDTVSDILIDNNGDKWISSFGGLIFTNIK